MIPPRLGDEAVADEENAGEKSGRRKRTKARGRNSCFIIGACHKQRKPTAGGPWAFIDALRDKFLTNRALTDDVDGAVSRSHKLLLAVDSELVIKCHRQVFDSERIVLRLRSSRIRGPVNAPAFDSTAGENDAEN